MELAGRERDLTVKEGHSQATASDPSLVMTPMDGGGVGKKTGLSETPRPSGAFFRRGVGFRLQLAQGWLQGRTRAR